MKKFLLVVFLILFSSICAIAKEVDYQRIYRELEMPDFSYIHNIDPDQYYENQGYTWSPYPLFRLNAPLYFKSITIEPGYYNLTPRENKGKYYILFKESGLVKHIVPVYDKSIVSEFFYEENLPKAKLTFGQKFQIKSFDFIGKWFPSAKRKPIPNTFIEITDLDNNFVSIVIYYKEYRYYTIFRTVKL